MREFEKKLQLVDWVNLGMKDIPNWIGAFASADEQLRKNAYVYLDLVVNKGAESPENLGKLEQVIASEGLVYIVPILIELLADEKIQNKGAILDILSQLVPCIQFNNTKSTLEPYRSRAIRVYEAIRAGIPLYRYLYREVDSFGKDIITEILETFENEK